MDRTAGNEHDGEPWFIGSGAGFDVNRFLVYANNEGDAEEIVEERWPDRWGDRIPKKEEAEAEESGLGTFFSRGRVWYTPEDVRIFVVATRVVKGTPVGASEAKLSTGEVIRYT